MRQRLQKIYLVVPSSIEARKAYVIIGSLKQKHIIMAKRTGMESYFAMGQVKQKLLHNQP